jgi:hypothetical protein
MVVIQNTLNDSSINENNLTNTLQQVIVELGYGIKSPIRQNLSFC